MIEAEVFKYAYKLQDMLAKANTRLNKLDRASADALIERDFLKKPRNNWDSASSPNYKFTYFLTTEMMQRWCKP